MDEINDQRALSLLSVAQSLLHVDVGSDAELNKEIIINFWSLVS